LGRLLLLVRFGAEGSLPEAIPVGGALSAHCEFPASLRPFALTRQLAHIPQA